MKFRTLTAFAALLLACQSFGQSAAPKITYTTVAVPINRALAEISKQAGIKLTAAPAVSGEIIVLSLKGVSLDDVKIQIAKACSAKWEAVEGGEMLIPDTIQRRQEEQKEKTEYATKLATSLKRLVDSLNPPKKDPKAKPKQGETAEAEDMMFGLGGRGAADKALIRLMQGVGANALASIDSKSRVVYASNPNRMQRPMPNGANQILAQLVTEYNAEVIKNQRDKSEVTEPEDERMKKFREFFGEFEPEQKPIEGIPSKALMICARQQMLGGLMITLKVYNDQGKVIITGTQMLSGEGGMFGGMDLADIEFGPDGMPKQKPKPKTETNEKPIEFSATTKELMNMSNFMTMSSTPTKMSDELRAKLLNPDMYDPLSFFHSEALLATAAQRGKPLVAVLPDAMSSFMSMFMPKGEALMPSSYLESVAEAISVSSDSPIILVRPLKPASSRADRADRVALGSFLKAVDAKGSVSLDDLATYAQKSVSPMEDGITMTYFMIFAPNAVQSGFGGQVSWEMLRFWGATSTNQRKSLSEGGRMMFNQLNPIQAAALRQMTFGPETNLTVFNPNAKKRDFEMPSFLMEALSSQLSGDYRSEPTEIMPNGLPGEGYLELKLTQDNVAKPTGNIPAMFGNAVLGADEFALLKMFKDMPGMEQMSAFIPNIDEVRLGDRSVYDFKFTVSQGVTTSKTLNDDRISAKSPVVKMANLPANFAKKIDDRVAVFKKIPFFDPSFFAPGNQGVPPPMP